MCRVLCEYGGCVFVGEGELCVCGSNMGLFACIGGVVYVCVCGWVSSSPDLGVGH